MKFIKRMAMLTVSLGAALALVVTAPLAANAVVTLTVDTDGVNEIEPDAPAAERDAHVRAALQEREGKQSHEEIEALSKLPGTIYWVRVDT